MPNDISGQAQAAWFNQANSQASMPRYSGMSTRPIPMQPINRPAPVAAAPSPIAGLFSQPLQPSGVGGLMDFNKLAFDMAQPQSQMAYNPQIMNIFRRALPMLPPQQAPKEEKFTDSPWHKIGMSGIYGLFAPHKLRGLF